jgi:hypothetical protein
MHVINQWCVEIASVFGWGKYKMSKDHEQDAVAEFIRQKGVTRCPTACASPTQAIVAAQDRTRIREYGAAKEAIRQARFTNQRVTWR